MSKSEATKIPGPSSSKKIEAKSAMTSPKPGSFNVTKTGFEKGGQMGGSAKDYVTDDSPQVTKVGSDVVASAARKKVSFGAP